MTRMSTNQPISDMATIKRLIAGFLLGLIGISPSFSAYAEHRILMVLSSEAPVYGQVYQAFNTELIKATADHSLKITRVTLDTKTRILPAASDPQQPSLIIAVGSKASAYVNHTQTSTPVLSILVTQDAWHKIWASSTFQQNKTAIYLDQPYQRLIHLCGLLPGKVSSLGAIFGPLSLDKFKTMEHFSDAQGLRLNARILKEEDNPIAILEPLFKNSDLFLALPDAAVFNRATAKWVLILSIKYKKPVIGFSKAYTDAGALAALHSTPKDTGKDAAHWVKQWLKNQEAAIPSPRFNRVFTLSTNTQVARSLKIPAFDPQSLKQSLAQLYPGNKH